MKNWYKNERGSMAVYVVVTLLSFIMILAGIFMNAASIRKNQLKTLPKIKQAYEKPLEIKKEIYQEQLAKRNLHINIVAYTGVYDGLEHDELSNVQITDGKGEDLTKETTITYMVNNVVYIPTKKVKNVADSKIITYKVTHPLYGTIIDTVEVKITPAILTITTGSANKTYDGKPLTLNEYQVEGLKNNETVTVTMTGTQTEIGVSKNTFNLVWADSSMQNNYEIVQNLGDLTVEKGEPIDRSRPSKINIAFVDMNNNPISPKNVPTPKLGSGMTAKKWNGTAWVNATNTAPGGDWYNYENKQWANAQTADGSMWVWVPRYSYMIEYLGSDGKTVVGYSNSDGIVEIGGKVQEGTTKTGVRAISGTVDGKTISKYVLHPAFTTNTTNGGWSSELAGIWVAKFEASKNDATASSAGSGTSIKVQPGVVSWRSIPVNDIFTKCKSYNSALNSHMMKNSEWGACAYLSKSIYGINGEIWINPNSSFVTGQAGDSVSASETTSTNAYQTTNGVKASTTGNVYGIYDMSGGAMEYVATYVNNEHNYLQTYGASLVNSSSGHLKQVYSKGSSDSNETNYEANKGRYGDAVYETSTIGSGATSWYGDFSRLPSEGSPFFCRGSFCSNGLNAGGFSFDDNTGNSREICGFRPVLALAV